MGFLLTSYNSLPEQVEANKEKCKDLQEQIDNIDTHEIEEVKAQVQTNTQNIANVTQGLGVTNTALNAVTQDVDDLETELTKKVDKSTQYTNSKNEISGDANSFDMRRTQGDVDSLDETYVNHGVNTLSVGYKYSENGTIVRKSLATYNEDGINFYKTGTDFKVDNKVIVTEENISQYTSKLYLHHITAKSTGSGSTWVIQWLCSRATPFTLETFAQYLYDKNIRSGTNPSDSPVSVISVNNGINRYMRAYSPDGIRTYAYITETNSQYINADFVDNVFEL